MKRIAVAAVGCGLACCAACAEAWGQQAIGRIKLEDATVTGPMEVSAGTAIVRGGTAIVAKDHTAELQLARGGVVSVCQTSSLHVTAANNVSVAAPLLLALDRGALEVRMTATQRDGLMTPDLRLTPKDAGTLDLRVRTTTNGDTCVENRGERAPVLEVTEQFGDGRYELQPGQHVLFEHGSVREVVDRERSPCGCPAAPVISVAESGVAAKKGEEVAVAGSAAAQAEAQHPFPAAESQGLTTAKGPAASVPQAPTGELHAQVAATMNYVAPADAGPSGATASAGSGRAAERGANGGGGAVTAPVRAVAVPMAPVTPAAAATNLPSAGAGGGGATGAVRTPAPAAVKPTPVRPEPSAERHVPVQMASAPVRKASAPPGGEPRPEVKAEVAPPPKAPGPGDLAHGIGRLFKKLFGRR